jgi:hypothetical protein
VSSFYSEIKAQQDERRIGASNLFFSMIRPPREQEDNEKGVRKASRKSAIGRSHHTNNRKIVRLIGPPIADPCFGGGKGWKGG